MFRYSQFSEVEFEIENTILLQLTFLFLPFGGGGVG